LINHKNEDGISPVIGVILMVAITVILSAIIVTLVFNITGTSLQKTKVVATSVTQSGSDIWITYRGGTNDPELSYIAIIAPNGVTYNSISTKGELATTGSPVRPDIGSVMTLYGDGTDGKDHVVVVGHFTDGAIQVLLDSSV
jgi:flagellin-like protein